MWQESRREGGEEEKRHNGREDREGGTVGKHGVQREGKNANGGR